MHHSRRIRCTVIAASFILALTGLARARQQDPTPAAASQEPAAAPANSQESTAAEPDLALKLSWSNGTTFNPIPGSLFSSPPLLPTTRDSSGAPLPRMAEFAFVREGPGVRITVAIRRAESNEPAKQIASYLVNENQTVEIRELLEYGAWPCQATVVRFKPRGAELPSFSSGIASLQLVRIDRESAPFPSYRVTVKNVGVKPIVEICTATNGGTGCGSSQGPEGQALIGPGANYSWYVSNSVYGQETPEGYVPNPINSLSVAGVVYTDDTYEGDASSARAALAYRAAQRILLPRVIKLVNQALASEGAAAASGDTEPASKETALVDLKSSLLGLKLDFSDRLVTAFTAVYPALADEARKVLPDYYRGALTWLEDSLRQDLDEFDRLPPSADSESRTTLWLTTTRDKYSRWLARLSPKPQPRSQ